MDRRASGGHRPPGRAPICSGRSRRRRAGIVRDASKAPRRRDYRAQVGRREDAREAGPARVAPRPRPRRILKTRLGLEGPVRVADLHAAPTARVVRRLGARALHDGRKMREGRHRGVRPVPRGRHHVPRVAPRQLVVRAQVGDFGPGGRPPRTERRRDADRPGPRLDQVPVRHVYGIRARGPGWRIPPSTLGPPSPCWRSAARRRTATSTRSSRAPTTSRNGTTSTRCTSGARPIRRAVGPTVVLRDRRRCKNHRKR